MGPTAREIWEACRGLLWLCMRMFARAWSEVVCVCLCVRVWGRGRVWVAHLHIQDCPHQSSQQNRVKPSGRAEKTGPFYCHNKPLTLSTMHSVQFTGWQMYSPFMLIKSKLSLQKDLKSKYKFSRPTPPTLPFAFAHMCLLPNVLPWSQGVSELQIQMQGTSYHWRKRDRHISLGKRNIRKK